MYPNEPRRTIWKPLGILMGVGLVLASIWLVLYLTRHGTITISSEPGAELFVATSRGAEFKKIGTTTATFKSRQTPLDVYFMAARDGKKTISGTTIKRGDNKPLKLALTNKVEAKQIANQSLANVYLEGVTGQGIIPAEFTLVNFRTDGDVPLRPDFAGLPYIKKVVWYDANNFVYSSFNQGVGSFINGKPLYSNGIGTEILGTNETDDAVYEEDFKLLDISKVPGQPLVLSSSDELFLSDTMGSTLRPIAKFEAMPQTISSLFTTKSHIYRHSGEEPAAYASEENVAADQALHSSVLYEYDYQGKNTNEFTIPDSTVRAMAEKNNKTFILTPDKLITLEGGTAASDSLYFKLARDLTSYKDRILLLGDGGVWQISEDGTSSQLLFEFGDGAGLAQSFSTSGDTLIFGTQPTADGQGSAKMFSIRL